MAAKKKYVSFKSPVGVGQYVKLDKAYKWDDASERSLPDPDGDMSTNLVVNTKDAQEFLKTVKSAIAESGIKPKHLPFSDQVDENKQKTGKTVFKFKAYGKTRDGEINKIKFFDASGKRVKGTVRVTAGSTLRIQGWISVSKMGARLNIREVQIIDLVESGGGFDAYEGGSFSADDVEDDENNNNNDQSSETEEDTDDDIPF